MCISLFDACGKQRESEIQVAQMSINIFTSSNLRRRKLLYSFFFSFPSVRKEIKRWDSEFLVLRESTYVH